MSDRREWFAPRRYGLGTGWPIAWQGWAMLGLLLAAFGLAFLLFGNDNPWALAIVLPAIVGFMIVAALTTKGGWRWRWGDKE